MTKLIIACVLLVWIIVPTVFWTFDLIKVSVNPNSIASTLYDSAYATKKTGMAAETIRKSVEDEYAQIAADIKEIEEMLNGSEVDGPTLNSDQILALRSELGDLLKRRESILHASTAVKEAWTSLSRLAQIETIIATHSGRFQHEKAAAVVNRFIDAVVAMDVDQVKALSAISLRKELDLARIRTMRRNTPDEVENGFELREAGKNRLEVWAGQKLATLCSQHDGSWRFEEAWE